MKRNICIFEIKKKAAGFALLLCLFLTFGFLSGCGKKGEEKKPVPTGELSEEEGAISDKTLQEGKGSFDAKPLFPSDREPLFIPVVVPPCEPEREEFEIEGDVLVSYRGTAQDVVVPEGVRVIGEEAFFNASDLLSVVLPEGVTTIKDAAFNGCKQLSKAVLPKSLETIGDRAFSGCRTLETIDLQNVWHIGSYAFYKCHALTFADLTRVRELKTGAFMDAGLREVEGMEELEEIGDSAFGNTLFLDNYWATCSSGFLIRNHILIMACKSDDRLEIPEGVEVIAPGAFRNISVNILVIPESIKEIKGGAFDCYLRTVYAPTHGIEIGYRAFGGSTSNMKVLPLSGREDEKTDWDFLIVGNTLLRYRGRSEDIIIPDGVKVIGENAFYEGADIVSVSLPEGLTAIRQKAFSECYSLSTILLPDSLCLIGESAFLNCSSLKEINLHNVQEIDEDAFRGCSQLESVDLTSAKVIGKQAFFCSGISRIFGMGQLTSCGGNVFGSTPFSSESMDKMQVIGNVLLNAKGCEGDIIIPEGVEIIADRALERAAVTSVKCPDSLKIIGEGAFSSCTDLEQFIMGDQVVSLGDAAFFGNTNLSDIRLSKSLEKIPEMAFMDCENLRMLTIWQGCDVSNLKFSSSQNFTSKMQWRLITMPLGEMVPKFLKGADSANYRIFTTGIEPGSSLKRASKEYGFQISQLELVKKEVSLRVGEEDLLIFSSGAKADWFSQDEAVVSVDGNGKLCAKTAGETKVVGTIYGEEYECRVVVE